MWRGLMDLRGNWNYPTTVRFGAGRISELGEAVKAGPGSVVLFHAAEADAAAAG